MPPANRAGDQFDTLVVVRHKPVLEDSLKPSRLCRVSGRNGGQFTLLILRLRIPLRRRVPGLLRPIVVVRTVGARPCIRSAGLPVTLGICATTGDYEVLGISHLAFAVHSQTLGDGLPTAQYFPGFEIN